MLDIHWLLIFKQNTTQKEAQVIMGERYIKLKIKQCHYTTNSKTYYFNEEFFWKASMKN